MENITSKEVLDWTESFLIKAEQELSKEEKKEQKKYASLVSIPSSKILLSKMLDESSQIRDDRKLAKRMKILIDRYGVPEFFNIFDRIQLSLFAAVGYRFHKIAMPIFRSRLRQETNKIIIAEERPELTRHLADRSGRGIGQNVNLLGEVVLGNAEADNRYRHYLQALEEKDINYISIKISGIYAQIHPLNYAQSKTELCKRLANIYQQAIDFPYTDKEGKTTPKFVNLDMEEYKDVELTLDVFITVLSMPQFRNLTAGIVIQAYLPDAGIFHEKLLKFAKQRYSEGGAPLKMRLVKGANLQMETIVSSLRGWEKPILKTKVEVDANYLHLLDVALKPENAEALHVGVASHNFFTIGYAYLLSKRNGVGDYVSFEMLEGMANHLPRVMQSLKKQVVLYTPVVKKEHFLNAVSYLVRRLDENTGEDNFLRYSFNLKLNSKEWGFLENQFVQAYELKDKMIGRSSRKQNRNLLPNRQTSIDVFRNEPDTDLNLSVNREWALGILKKWKTEFNDRNFIVPVQIGDKEIETEYKKKYYDRNRDDKICMCEANLSSSDQVAEILSIAEEDKSGWRKTTLDKRNKILHQVAENLSAKRGDLIGCMVAITGKTFTEADVEVSEGIDFCCYYPISMKRFSDLQNVSYSPKGVVLVISPWNFPLAIPVGGVAAALSAGNTVILKPATVSLPIAWELAKCFWDAGVAKDALQVVCPAERSTLDRLTSHPVIKHIIFTGGTETAFNLLKNNPKCHLSAETGGKNAIILTGRGDQDHAIMNVVSSAFGNAGQKCSACSLFLVAKEVYEDPVFKAKLKDAVTSIQTGSAWNPENIVGPMVDNNNEKLLHAISHLEEGESWLVEPEFLDEKKYILKPCVKWGVKPGSYTFRTELFAPLLAVVCIENLREGIEFVNSTEYGLTSGLQTLDEKEICIWKKRIEAGNLYINRGITGAIVRRQPFGGMKHSAFGGGVKAGGPNYVSSLVKFTENLLPAINPPVIDPPLNDLLADSKCRLRLNYAFSSYKKAWDEVFAQEKDVSNIYGESNTLRYLPLQKCIFRIEPHDDICDILLVILASVIANVPLTISMSDMYDDVEDIKQSTIVLPGVKVFVQKEPDFIGCIKNYERIRSCAGSLSEAVYEEAAKLGLHIVADKPIVDGRIELLHYLKEQSISTEYHRYGSVF
ncbi:bifunctional proline dehydrogenase/L-glutamate gamma-semialdehyde dehydrogenase [Dysgonomonas sp. 520]|uniref:bifunctional proline dehydrogenase/L-glutamate gamma-semialdehyde dehydrogenase n=1 Tax=Dysgonomonas sp. 520 TaxID=2302931 RepID=UPI0013D008BD|nr:bifunctional proline dehydrogenase/L-glutamate gamma-semialdehyde dehydrogenase [Dysgonomonas sp. 520]NDW09796.1 aldehyde dehydrogenase family protein [Dysgonomonas sp. 520]